MPTMTITRRWTAGAITAALALTAFVPVAQAGHGRGDGRKVRAAYGPRVIERVVLPQRTVYVRHSSSDAAPVLAGLIGGFVLGTLVSHAAPAVEASTTYWDPYCEDRFVSLDRYEYHLRHCRHPRRVRLIDARSGECVGREVWRDGGWYREGDPYGRDGGVHRHADDGYDEREGEWR